LMCLSSSVADLIRLSPLGHSIVCTEPRP
jgi:hypothetical protein